MDSPLYDYGIFIELLNMEWPFLLYLARDISNQVGISTVDLIDYLQNNKKSNASFHLNHEIEEFAMTHSIDQDYDVDKFINKEQLLINIHPKKMKQFSINAKKNEDTHWFQEKQC